MNFLISYHRPSGEVDITSYTDMQRASREVLQKELRETNSDIEHVVVVADSLQNLKLTHSRYFMRSGNIQVKRAAQFFTHSMFFACLIRGTQNLLRV